MMIQEVEKNVPVFALKAEPREGELADAIARQNDAPVEKPEVTEELVIEEVSIDGMCGVY